MAHRRRSKSTLVLSAEQARRALLVLIHEGQLAAAEVRKALNRRDRLVKDLKARLAALGAGGMAVSNRLWRSAGAGLRSAERATRASRRRARRISAATRKMYQQQGRYMAAVRQLPTAARKKIRAIREKSGVDAAIAAAKRMAK